MGTLNQSIKNRLLARLTHLQYLVENDIDLDCVQTRENLVDLTAEIIAYLTLHPEHKLVSFRHTLDYRTTLLYKEIKNDTLDVGTSQLRKHTQMYRNEHIPKLRRADILSLKAITK